MKRDTRKTRLDYRDLLLLSRSFAKQEDGSITIFACFMIFCMVLIGGIGVDMMRHEMERTRIQAVSDRAVLAAADLDQELDPDAVVRDYFAKSGMEDYVSSVSVDQGINFRKVTVEADMNMNTQFMDFLGVDSLTVPGLSTAEEKIEKVEISMVLDISGSMRENNKMQNLRNAAGEFIDAVLTPENRDLISISVVPYTAQVNVGEDIVDEMNVNQVHDWSFCVDFADTDFSTTSVRFGNAGAPYEHMQHFETGWSWNGRNNGSDNITNPTCPNEPYEEVTSFSQNAAALKGQINQFQPRSNTSIHLGMKWGVAMLDPSWQSFNQVLPGVPAVFRNRPAPYPPVDKPSSADTLKTIILMTDGQNVDTNRIGPQVYANYNHRLHWSNYPLDWYLDRYVRSSDHYFWRTTKYTASQADYLLANVCSAAKAKKIVIWSIGFEVTDHGANVMRNCASSPSHFFRVEGIEITDAFQSIARQLNQLRLTQ
ncbi:Flp pilus assembly protein TadG [Sulfitobacter noctilucae]|uniref:Tad domain-containing protein n=1 Tax=Sulfitobacter noctilucae TaxID=1342302 RepID=UPI00046877BB|nr:Tad domain-containing protein [Sulfitobacter noctilucae]KIN60395.1 Flp pilus assembly protein TadG [Sulfitobacter noctilucae]